MGFNKIHCVLRFDFEEKYIIKVLIIISVIISLNMFKAVKTVRFFIPGNMDFWLSQQQKLIKRSWIHSLDVKNIICNGDERELRKLNASEKIISATLDPNTSRLANDDQKEKCLLRKNKGIDYPDYFVLESVKERLDGYDISSKPGLEGNWLCETSRSVNYRPRGVPYDQAKPFKLQTPTKTNHIAAHPGKSAEKYRVKINDKLSTNSSDSYDSSVSSEEQVPPHKR
ncbi:hypothetical protein RhiirA4_426897 [Rhizophagus irregularis]|uniref:Uncharacterized protein n=1 Tax=Rhizophagus irregularis TaxID=588596 RepID=A0A2I1H6W3_9GLOM|nr:hypothetical protein RhiirA4_426897 [Rhizophagus irregularis]